MHEKFRRRLADLEEAAALANGPVQIVNIDFVDADGSPVDATVAGGRDFECWRREGEDLATFKARAHSACLATEPRGPMVLIFSEEHPQHAT